MFKGGTVLFADRTPTEDLKSAALLMLGALILIICASGDAFGAGLSYSGTSDVVIKKIAAGTGNRCADAEEYFVMVDSLRVHYIVSGAGPTLVMIHGNAGGVEDFRFGTLELLCREYRVVAIDRPGHGKSDRPSGKAASVEYQARLLHQTLLSLGITQPVLVGHSWGAALALAYALQYQGEVSAMVLLAPAAYAEKDSNRLLRIAMKPPILADLGLMIGKAIMGRHLLKRALERAFYPETVPNDYLRLAAASWLGRKQLRAYLEDEWSLNDSLKRMSRHYSEIHVPTVIVTGDEDNVVSAKDNAHRLNVDLPDAQLIELKDTGHQIPQTHPESIFAAVTLISASSRTNVPWPD